MDADIFINITVCVQYIWDPEVVSVCRGATLLP
jgi:hypothetical protein